MGGESGGESATTCDPTETFVRYGCSSSGCHAPPVQAQLDLVSGDLAARLADADAHTLGCEGRKVIDTSDPSRSLILQSVGASPPPAGDADTCQVQMPPAGALSEDDLECLRLWVDEVARDYGGGPVVPFEPLAMDVALRRVKTLLHGGALTAEELARAEGDPEEVRVLVEEWVGDPAFDRKLSGFLRVALQQGALLANVEQFDRLQAHPEYTRLVGQVLEESFVRTALEIVKRDEPFTKIATTTRWMMTTANLVLLLYPDQTTEDRLREHTLTPVESEAPATLSEQIAQRTWYIPLLPEECALRADNFLDVMFGFIARNRCRSLEQNARFTNGLITDADFEDWRPVEISRLPEGPGRPIDYYDLERLREATAIETRLPRLGFFTTSVFLNNWSTNGDNQFRVTANQALLTALHVGFASSEPTTPLNLEGVDEDHAAPDTDCFGCHKQLDPMRLYFGQHFNASYQLPYGRPIDQLLFTPPLSASFGFRGLVEDGGDLHDFGRMLAEHPRFGAAWVQKLCLYANAARCVESDPQFISIVERFEQSGYNLRAMITDLFSSPLITGLEVIESQATPPKVSITRRAHLCALLDERIDREGICEVPRVAQVLGLIPDDEFTRGAADPSQPASPSAFHFAAAEELCQAVAEVILRPNSMVFTSPEEGLTWVTSQLMGLTPTHPRYQLTYTLLDEHLQSAIASGASPVEAGRSLVTIACLSPDVMGLGL